MKLTVKILSAVLLTNFAAPCFAVMVYMDDFTGTSISSVWDENLTGVAVLDDPNDQVDYTHAAGTTRRWVSHNSPTAASPIFSSTEGYMKAEISNFTGASSVFFGFIEDNPANNANYAQTLVAGNGTYEMVVNNSSSSVAFDNSMGWSGTLGPQSGLFTTDGGTTSAALVFGGGVDADVNLKGFGFANFGNSTVFPSSSFSVDSIMVSDTAIVPEPAAMTLLWLVAGMVVCSRRRR